jgi:hypothetical protein
MKALSHVLAAGNDKPRCMRPESDAGISSQTRLAIFEIFGPFVGMTGNPVIQRGDLQGHSLVVGNFHLGTVRA